MSRIYVCPLSGLDKTLKESRARWMISLSGPGKSPARPAQIDQGFLALEFNDIDAPREGLVAPDGDHIRQLFDFLENWDRQGPLVIHCWMGISRSTATALLARAFFNPGQDMQELALDLRKKSPSATPNPLMIALGDEQLGLDGALIHAVRKIGRGEEAAEGTPFVLELSS